MYEADSCLSLLRWGVVRRVQQGMFGAMTRKPTAAVAVGTSSMLTADQLGRSACAVPHPPPLWLPSLVPVFAPLLSSVPILVRQRASPHPAHLRYHLCLECLEHMPSTLKPHASYCRTGFPSRCRCFAIERRQPSSSPRQDVCERHDIRLFHAPLRNECAAPMVVVLPAWL